MVRKAYIKQIDYYLPADVVSNEDIVTDFPEWSVEKIARKVGVNKSEVSRDEIDYVLFCTQSPDYFLPTSACIIQDKLGLRRNIGALDFNLGCSGYVYGLSLAKGLISCGVANSVLLLTGETYNKHLHPKDKGNRTIFGDAASATVISTNGISEIGDFSLGTDGSGADNLIVRSGGMRIPDLSFDENNNPVSSDYLYMNGAEIFTFTLDNVPPLIDDVLSKNGLAKDDIDLYVFHQANKYMLNFLRKKIHIEEERFYYCLSEVGNTVSNSIPIALKTALDDGAINGKMKVAIAGFGVGYSWGSTILYFNS